MRRRCLRLAAVALTIGGCALSPQQADIRPAVGDTGLPPGLDRSVTVTVRDLRPDARVGSRGGVYADTAAITTGPGFADALREAVAEELVGAGYFVAAPGASADLDMLIRVEALDYAVSGKVPKRISASARLGIDVRGATGEYTGRAGVERSREVLTAPGREDNEALLGDLVSEAATGLLADRRLHGFLAGEPAGAP